MYYSLHTVWESLRFESYSGMWVNWVLVLRMRPYKPKSCITVGVARKKKSMSAKNRSKFAALLLVMVTVAR
jgi:hypothetical protein